MNELTGKRVTVMGLGRFGGGLGVARWLAERGADVLVTDLESESDLSDSVARLADLVDRSAVRLRLGGHNVADFSDCDLVIANPAVPRPWENRFLRSAEAAGVPITTEIGLLIEQLSSSQRERTVGVTGSVGKSTTAAMIHHALSTVASSRGGRAVLGGNIGGSLLAEAEGFDDRTWLVLELSSAMLYWLDRTRQPKWSPRVGVFTNLSPNHIDWHGELGHYTRSKLAMFAGQSRDDVAVLGESVWELGEGLPSRRIGIDPAAFEAPLRVPGAHNRVNAAAALSACLALVPDADEAQVRRAIAGFAGLAHRLQLVCERRRSTGGEPVRFYNDSKSTTPESAVKAIEAIAAIPGMTRSRIHLIAGGYDKGSSLAPISTLARSLGGLYAIGATGPTLVREAGESRAIECGTLEAAIARAAQSLKPGDAVLLSPGCASWDQFTNFEERGDRFARMAKEIAL